MGAGGVVALKLIVDFCRSLELLFQAVGPHQGGGTVHFIEVPDFLGNGDLPGVVVQLLADQLVAEHGAQVVKAHGGAGAGIQQRGGLVLHIGPDVIPGFRHLVLGEIDFVGDFRLGFHSVHSFQKSAFSKGCVKKRPSSQRKGPVTGSAVPPKLAIKIARSAVCQHIPFLGNGGKTRRSLLRAFTPFGPPSAVHSTELSLPPSHCRRLAGRNAFCLLVCVIGLCYKLIRSICPLAVVVNPPRVSFIDVINFFEKSGRIL